MIHFHKWLKWSRLVKAYGGSKYQFRSCAVCGKIQHRSLGYLDGVEHGAANTALLETGFDPVPPPAKHDTGSRNYDRAEYLPQKREAMKRWADWLAVTVEPKDRRALKIVG